jgi:Putative peptidoglycan binding domain
MKSRVVLCSVLLAGCRASSNQPAAATSAPAAAVPVAGCDVTAFAEGKARAHACDETGLVTVDLRDEWAPRLFAVQPDGTAPAFRATYLALAAERGADAKALPPSAALLELYGIVPSLAIVRARFAEAGRVTCRAGIDPAPMLALARPYGQETAGTFKFAIGQRAFLGPKLEAARAAKQLPDLAALATDKELGAMYTRWRAAEDLYAGLVVTQRLLVCEGVLDAKYVDGTFSWSTGAALELFQRRHFLIPNGRVDPETRAALATDPRELDYRFALRVLRERVVDATGLVEDGTAGAGPQPILGHMLDPEPMRGVRGRGRGEPNGAPDLIAQATESAARALGWTTPAATAAWLASYAGGLRVALPLPPPPAYHSAHMDLSAEIDRGDVWYDASAAARPSWRRPALVLYVQDGATKRALVRWPTTIGGWSDVNVGGAVVKRWKESDVGPREWRELYAAPTWLPPSSTPDSDLVRWVAAGKWELKRSILGPGPQAAFGMMLLPHHQVKSRVWTGIGTHGSAVVTSILNGTSHGCHRLYNQLAVRLGSFLLRHRTHVVKGQQPERYRRVLHAGGTHTAKIDTRGFLYELTPPISIDVLRGNIRSERKIPPADALPAGAE